MRPVPCPAFDYLIVGQGLVGSIVAWLLIREGRRVIVADSQPESAASMDIGGSHGVRELFIILPKVAVCGCATLCPTASGRKND